MTELKADRSFDIKLSSDETCKCFALCYKLLRIFFSAKVSTINRQLPLGGKIPKYFLK